MTRIAAARFARLLLVACTLLGSIGAGAVHVVHERFTVWGQVTTPDGRPVVGKRVLIIVTKGRDSVRVNTNAEGWYRKVLTVTDADVGKVFDVQVDRDRKHVTIEFDPADHRTERGARVDFVVGE